MKSTINGIDFEINEYTDGTFFWTAWRDDKCLDEGVGFATECEAQQAAIKYISDQTEESRDETAHEKSLLWSRL